MEAKVGLQMGICCFSVSSAKSLFVQTYSARATRFALMTEDACGDKVDACSKVGTCLNQNRRIHGDSREIFEGEKRRRK
jgi:hypothetical protein